MNRQSFNVSKENGRKQFDAFLKVLLDYNANKDNDDYNDIHIYQEETLMIIEWDKIPYNHEWGGSFQYIDFDDAVMKDVTFPDEHHEYLFPSEVDDELKKWHDKHPEWVKTEYGTWTNMEENRRFAIACNFKTWMERKVEDNDSSFNESFFESSDHPEIDDCKTVICSVDDDILRRTDYVVMSESLLNKLGEYFKEELVGIHKLEDVTVMVKSQYDDKLDYSTIHVYVTNYLTDNAIYYLTDNDYLIHRLKVEFRK